MKYRQLALLLCASLGAVFLVGTVSARRWTLADENRRIEIIRACRDGIDFSLGLNELNSTYPQPRLTLSARTTGAGTLVMPSQTFVLNARPTTIDTINGTERIPYFNTFRRYWVSNPLPAAGARIYFVDDQPQIIPDLDMGENGRAILAEVHNCFLGKAPPETFTTTTIYLNNTNSNGNPPIPMPRVAYIYATDTSTLSSYANVLGQNGLVVEGISVDQAVAQDFSLYNVIMIGPDTANGSGWGTLAAFQNITRFGKAYIALGFGGYRFLAALGSGIAAAKMTDGYIANQLQNIFSPFSSRFYTPYYNPLDGAQTDIVTLYTQKVPVILPFIDASTSFPASVLKLADGYSLAPGQAGFALLSENVPACRTYWGFQVSPGLLTRAGANLLTNIVYWGGCSQPHLRSITRIPLQVSDDARVATLNLYLELENFAPVNQLTISLTAPSGKTETLVRNAPSGTALGGDFTFDNPDPATKETGITAMLRLDDETSRTFATLAPPYSQSAVQPNAGYLAAFRGEPTRGTWWLTISSTNSQGSGNVYRWGLEFLSYRIYIPLTRR